RRPQHVRRRLTVDHRRDIGHGLRVLALLEVHAPLSHGGLARRRRAGGDLLREIELRARIVGLAARAVGLALDDQYPRTRRRIELTAEELLVDRLGVPGPRALPRRAREGDHPRPCAPAPPRARA